MTISHVAIYVEDLKKATDFYLAVLAPLGYRKIYEIPEHVHGAVGLGSMWPDFWLYQEEHPEAKKEKIHIAFSASNRQQVRDFHALALKAGAVCNGKPGVRAEYTKTYYAAYVLDAEGRNIEVHCMMPSIIGEPTSRNKLIIAGSVIAAAGLSYFANLGGYLQSFV